MNKFFAVVVCMVVALVVGCSTKSKIQEFQVEKSVFVSFYPVAAAATPEPVAAAADWGWEVTARRRASPWKALVRRPGGQVTVVMAGGREAFWTEMSAALAPVEAGTAAMIDAEVTPGESIIDQLKLLMEEKKFSPILIVE